MNKRKREERVVQGRGDGKKVQHEQHVNAQREVIVIDD